MLFWQIKRDFGQFLPFNLRRCLVRYGSKFDLNPEYQTISSMSVFAIILTIRTMKLQLLKMSF